MKRGALICLALLVGGCSVTLFKKDPTADIVRTLGEVMKAQVTPSPTPSPSPTPEGRR